MGKLLGALGRHPYRPAHLHYIVEAEGFEPLTTHIFDPDDPYIHSDAVFGVKESLLAEFRRVEDAERAPRDRDSSRTVLGRRARLRARPPLTPTRAGDGPGTGLRGRTRHKTGRPHHRRRRIAMVPQPRFRANETHGMVRRSSARIRASSEGRNWCALYASAQLEAPYEDDFAAVDDILLVHHRSGPVRVDRRGTTGRTDHALPSRGIHVIPGGMDVGIRLHGMLRTLHVYVRRSVVEEVARDLVAGDPARVELPPRFIDTDPILSRMLDLVGACLVDDDPSADLHADDLARLIARRLVLAHAAAPCGAADHAGTRGPSRAIGRAIDFMRENLDRSILLDDIARASNLSGSHFARIFRTEVGVPPHRFLLKLRVDEARRLLGQTDLSIAEIAYACGFSHQEHMTRAFRAHLDTTPGAYRKQSAA